MQLPFEKNIKSFIYYFLGSNLKWFYFVIVLSLLATVVLTFRTYSLKFLIDALLLLDRDLFVQAFYLIILIYGGGKFLRCLADYMFVSLVNKPALRMRLFAFEYLLKQPFEYYQNKMAGKVLGNFAILRKSFSEYYRLQLQYMKILEVLIIIGIALSMSVYIGVVFVFFGLGLVFIYRHFTPKIKDVNIENQRVNSLSFGMLFDYISNIRVVRAFNLQALERQRFQGLFANMEKLTVSVDNIEQYFKFCTNVLLVVMDVFVFLFLIALLKKDLVSVGDVSILYLYLDIFKGKVLSFAKVYPEVCGEYAAIEQGIQKTFEPLTEQDVAGAIDKIDDYDIEFRNVTLKKESKVLLDNVSLKIPFGKKVGLVGKSGAGKSSLISTLLRVFYPDKSQVFVGGVDITELKLSALLDVISIVDQDTLLLNDTVLMNLTLGRKFSDKEVENALRQAFLWDFVESLDDKLETMVGERGVKLSGGQRQRIGIARAILFDTPVVVLDEATASLDVDSERYIQKSIKNLIKNKTVICIAHRLSTLDIMDEIVVMDKGRIVELGTQDQLIGQQGIFAELWNHQNNNFINAE